MLGIVFLKKSAAFSECAARVLFLVPRLSANGVQKTLHGVFITAKELVIQIAGVPIDQYSANVPHRGRWGAGHWLPHAARGRSSRACLLLLQGQINQPVGN